ncbi:MAG TPA: antibiotic biosynthesis monooxygenase [Myxococcota bacterium]|nr:antibiotic biosynthesis monooxygenase [Myxococcota bacterium]
MPSILATLKVKKDKIDEAKEGFRKLAATVKANEPGTLAYVFHQRKDEPATFIVYEKYADDAAFKKHGENLRAHGAVFAGVLDGRPEITFLDEL